MQQMLYSFNSDLSSALTFDIEDWFHILDSSASPPIEKWKDLESRIAANVEMLLEVLDDYSVKCTMFWLGWIAERNKNLLRRCVKAGHEIASHGYGHVLAYKVGRKAFNEDIRHGKTLLEDITGQEVKGFRAAGFSAKDDTPWVFDAIKRADYSYDSSVFPASRGHGGMMKSQLVVYVINTEAGNLVEIPQSIVEIFGKRVSFFGGGYLRLAPIPLIKLGIEKLHKSGRPLIVYIHPREIDPDHPRLPLNLIRRFKCYVNLKSTIGKLEWLCKNYKFVPTRELAAKFNNNNP